MIKVIFEDNEESPVSKLLKESYNGTNIEFSGGGDCSNMLRVISKCKSMDNTCKIIIFYDLPPNNRKAYGKYR